MGKRTRAWLAAWTVASALAATAAPGSARAAAPRTGSIGSPSRGSLVGGVALAEEGADHYLLYPDRCFPPDAPGALPQRSNFYGHPSLVRVILAATAAYRSAHPDAPRIAVGDLSHETGGLIPRHLSHQSGRDADLYFPQRGADPRHPVPVCEETPPRYELPDASGVFAVPPTFERAWAWSLASALAAERDVQVIFVGALIKRELAAWAKANGVPAKERARTLGKLYVARCRAPKGVTLPFYGNNYCPHDDHFHVRLRCPRDSRGCVP
ncbi:MAG: penicillin-insensitive murein endopeptidase [Deltaproteobacteria bacterium]|nr:penicillin-insensitive murein endopeptidase [Deltaproteobacteria bacterium]